MSEGARCGVTSWAARRAFTTQSSAPDFRRSGGRPSDKICTTRANVDVNVVHVLSGAVSLGWTITPGASTITLIHSVVGLDSTGTQYNSLAIDNPPYDKIRQL